MGERHQKHADDGTDDCLELVANCLSTHTLVQRYLKVNFHKITESPDSLVEGFFLAFHLVVSIPW